MAPAARPLDGLRVLDLFAGSGALAFEALSRGAAHATLVDASAAACRVQRRNAESIGCSDECRIVAARLPGWIRKLPPDTPFDIVFADPPYALDASLQISLALREQLASPPQLLVYEHDASRPPAFAPGWGRVSQRPFGDTAVTTVRLEVPDTGSEA